MIKEHQKTLVEQLEDIKNPLKLYNQYKMLFNNSYFVNNKITQKDYRILKATEKRLIKYGLL